MVPIATSEDRKLLRTLSKAFNKGDRAAYYNAIARLEERLIDDKVKQQEGGRVCCPLEERYLQVLTVPSSSSKITINPVDGRVTLKVSEKASEAVRGDLIRFAEQVKSLDLPAITLRGRIDWHKGKYKTNLQSMCRGVVKFIEMEG